MRNYLLSALMAIFTASAACLSFSSCSDDESGLPDLKVGVPTTYSGRLVIDFNDGSENIEVDQDLIVTASSQKLCKFDMKNVKLFGDAADPFDIVTEDVVVVKEDNKRLYSGSDEIIFYMGDTPLPAKFTVTATEDADGHMSLTTEADVASRRHITCKFTGKKVDK